MSFVLLSPSKQRQHQKQWSFLIKMRQSKMSNTYLYLRLCVCVFVHACVRTCARVCQSTQTLAVVCISSCKRSDSQTYIRSTEPMM